MAVFLFLVYNSTMTFNIEWRSKEGYGDFITGMCYAHSSVLKYQRPVHIRFHWPNPEGHLLSSIDKEPIVDRFNHILSYMKPVKGLTISHKYSSTPTWRFINELEEFNPLHGLWYTNKSYPVEKKLVAFWTSKHNLVFPGYHKDPLYDHWHIVKSNLENLGYNVVEITYRTPIAEVMKIITTCEFGVGYEGMIHQLFKFTWRPIVVASQRVKLSKLLAIQGAIVTKPPQLLEENILRYVEQSQKNIDRLAIEHLKYINDVQDPTLHPLYNKPI